MSKRRQQVIAKVRQELMRGVSNLKRRIPRAARGADPAVETNRDRVPVLRNAATNLAAAGHGG